MNHQTITANVVTISLTFFLIVLLFSIIAKASYQSLYEGSDPYDQYTIVDNIRPSEHIWIVLKDAGFIDESVSFSEFDYICTLTQQLCQMTNRVTPDLALSVIAVESKFDVDSRNGTAYGLMQLIPRYHFDRMANFIEDPSMMSTDDFFDPRLNIMTGIDYLDSILENTNGDIVYALMWYNQGPISASKAYLDNQYISVYAKRVMTLSDMVKLLL